MVMKHSATTWDKTKRKTWEPRAKLSPDVERGFKTARERGRPPKKKPGPAPHGGIGAPEDFELVTRKRPSDVTMQIIEELLERMATGETVSRISSDPHMPPWLYIWLWLKDPKHAKFKEMYDLAEEAQLHRMAGETLDISDNAERDFIEVKDKNGKIIQRMPNHELVNRSKLRVDTRRWLLSKRMAKVYGDSAMIKLADQTGEGPATFLFGAIQATKQLERSDADSDTE